MVLDGVGAGAFSDALVTDALRLASVLVRPSDRVVDVAATAIESTAGSDPASSGRRLLEAAEKGPYTNNSTFLMRVQFTVSMDLASKASYLANLARAVVDGSLQGALSTVFQKPVVLHESATMAQLGGGGAGYSSLSKKSSSSSSSGSATWVVVAVSVAIAAFAVVVALCVAAAARAGWGKKIDLQDPKKLALSYAPPMKTTTTTKAVGDGDGGRRLDSSGEGNLPGDGAAVLGAIFFGEYDEEPRDISLDVEVGPVAPGRGTIDEDGGLFSQLPDLNVHEKIVVDIVVDSRQLKEEDASPLSSAPSSFISDDGASVALPRLAADDAASSGGRSICENSDDDDHCPKATPTKPAPTMLGRVARGLAGLAGMSSDGSRKPFDTDRPTLRRFDVIFGDIEQANETPDHSDDLSPTGDARPDDPTDGTHDPPPQNHPTIVASGDDNGNGNNRFNDEIVVLYTI